jgi:hypothetical protein
MTALTMSPDTPADSDTDTGARTLYLALDIDGDGAHPAASRVVPRPGPLPGSPPSPALIPALASETVRSVVAAAQDAGFTLATFADGPLPPAADPHSTGSRSTGPHSTDLQSVGSHSAARLEAGSAAGLVGLLRALSEVVDGVRLQPAVRSVDLPVVIEQVLPALIAFFEQYWGRDLSEYDPDSPLPDAEPSRDELDPSRGTIAIEQRTGKLALIRQRRELARDKGLSIRQLALEVSPGRPTFVGTPSQVADEWTHYVRTRAVDKFNITPHLLPASLVDIVEKLVPELQERGVYRTEYKGSTLREHLDLPPVDLPPVDQDQSA